MFHGRYVTSIIVKLLWSPGKRNGHNSFGLRTVRIVRELYHRVVCLVISVNIRKDGGLWFLLGCEEHNDGAAACTRDQDIYLCDLLHLQCNFKKIYLYISDFHLTFQRRWGRRSIWRRCFRTILSKHEGVFEKLAILSISKNQEIFYCFLKRHFSSVDLSACYTCVAGFRCGSRHSADLWHANARCSSQTGVDLAKHMT